VHQLENKQNVHVAASLSFRSVLLFAFDGQLRVLVSNKLSCLCCVVLFCVVLCCFLLCCVILCCVVLCCVVLFCVVSCCVVLSNTFFCCPKHLDIPYRKTHFILSRIM
jgi:hypothetical protein